MAGEAEIDDLPEVFFCLLHKWIRKAAEFVQTGYAPDDVVTHADIVQSPIQGRNARQHFVKRSHGGIPLSVPEMPVRKQKGAGIIPTPLPLR